MMYMRAHRTGQHLLHTAAYGHLSHLITEQELQTEHCYGACKRSPLDQAPLCFLYSIRLRKRRVKHNKALTCLIKQLTFSLNIQSMKICVLFFLETESYISQSGFKFVV